MPVQQITLIEARRTQNIEIMLRRIPGDTTADKTRFVLYVMQQILRMRASELKCAMLAMRQALNSAVQAPPAASGQLDAPDNSILSVLGPDLLGSVLNRLQNVRKVLHFAEASKESFRVVHSSVVWAHFYSVLVPSHLVDRGGGITGDTLQAVLTAVELMVENPLYTVPLQSEQDAFRWYAGDHARLSASNVFLMLVGESTEFAQMRASLGSGIVKKDFALELGLHLTSMRTLFQADQLADCFYEAREGIRLVLDSEALAMILLAGNNSQKFASH